MGLFSQIRKKEIIKIYSPTSGELYEISQLEDGVFSSKMMGDGFFIRPIETSVIEIKSPIEGVVESIFPTKHAIGLSNPKLSLLVHLGVDTVDLEGAPFELCVEIGAKVSQGQVLAKMNVEAILKAKKGPEVIIVFPDLHNQSFLLLETGLIYAQTVIGNIR